MWEMKPNGLTSWSQPFIFSQWPVENGNSIQRVALNICVMLVLQEPSVKTLNSSGNYQTSICEVHYVQCVFS